VRTQPLPLRIPASAQSAMPKTMQQQQVQVKMAVAGQQQAQAQAVISTTPGRLPPPITAAQLPITAVLPTPIAATPSPILTNLLHRNSQDGNANEKVCISNPRIQINIVFEEK
jgi:hypothetical protein